MNTFVGILFIAIVIILIILASRNIIDILFDFIGENAKQKRLRELKKVQTKTSLEFVDIVDTISTTSNKTLVPRLKRLIPGFLKTDMKKIKRDLLLIGWDDTFTPESYVGFIWALRIISIPIIIIALIFPFSTFVKLLILFLGVVIGFGIEYQMKSSVSNINEQLFMEFPDFIRITTSYLTANMTLQDAVSHSIKYVGEAWTPILKKFVVTCETQSIDTALSELKETTDLFEIQEFISLIRLSLEQGTKVRDSFSAQADKVSELQRNQFIQKVGKRKMYGQLVQMPLLLIDLVILALPTASNALSMLGGGVGLGSL